MLQILYLVTLKTFPPLVVQVCWAVTTSLGATARARVGAITLHLINAGPLSARSTSKGDFMPLGNNRPGSQTGTWPSLCMTVQSRCGSLDHMQTYYTGSVHRWKELTLTNSKVEEFFLLLFINSPWRPFTPVLTEILPFVPILFCCLCLALCCRSVPHQLAQQPWISNLVTRQTLSFAYFNHVSCLLYVNTSNIPLKGNMLQALSELCLIVLILWILDDAVKKC